MVSSTGLGGIKGSKHDFSNTNASAIWGSSSIDQICIFCHTPHNAMSTAALWNRNLPAQSFKPYASTTLESLPGQPGTNSLLCLSCHDGSVAIDAFVNRAGYGAPTMKAIGDVYYPGSITGYPGMNIGGNYTGNPNVNDLRDDHPVGIAYNAAVVATDGYLFDPTTTNLPRYGATGDRLECGSCHNAHGENGVAKFLRKDNTGSALCKTCHNK